MKEETINRAYLETLSFTELVRLSDEYGVDVPVDLDRRFLIAELLELYEESDEDEEMIIQEEGDNNSENLPKNYNETQICAVLRNPAWLFVFWNISENDSLKLKEISGCNLMLRICSLKDPKDPMPEEAFEIQATSENQEQYVLLPTGKKYIKVELVYVTPTTGQVLAYSPVITIPQGSDLINNFQFVQNSDFPPIIALSGIHEILKEQYTNHRHSFS